MLYNTYYNTPILKRKVELYYFFIMGQKEEEFRSTSIIEAQIDQATRERLHHPVVALLYEAYSSLGILSHLSYLVSLIPKAYREPITYTFGSHVTKEKPILVYTITPEIPEKESAFKTLAASVDLVWCLSLIYDDIFDKDQERAGKTATWIQFGEEFSLKAIQYGLNAVTTGLREYFGDKANRLQDYIQRGIYALQEHPHLSFNSSPEMIISNYLQKADFHTAFPVELLFHDEKSPQKKAALDAITYVNLAGQILNDLKDMSPIYAWVRTGFSDIRNGLVTLPVKVLWEGLDNSQKEKFMSLFGQGSLTDLERQFLLGLINSTRVMPKCAEIAREYYQASRTGFQQVGRKDLLYYSFRWIDYKLDQLNELEHE